MKFSYRVIVLAIIAMLSTGCESGADVDAGDSRELNEAPREETMEAESTEVEEEESEAPDFTGAVEREEILEGDANWRRAFEGQTVNDEGAQALGAVEPGAKIAVYLGVWCGDSVRELTRFWKVLDALDAPPFEVEYVGLDRQMDAGEVSLDELDIIAVPTFIVYRDGEEVGRVVERSPESIEVELVKLLSGEAEGMISATRE